MASFAFRPALVSSLTGYDKADFLKDLGSGITVGVIALPLAIGFAIASGVSPQQGLWTAIAAGAVVATLGGSRFQIAGPTGAFVPVLAAIVGQHGYEGLAVATVMAGVMLALMGLFKLGALLKYIPYPVTAGFTTGIATIIFIGQLNEGLGLSLKMPGHVPQQIAALATHLTGASWHAVAICGLAILIIYQLPRFTKAVPPTIVAVVVTTVLALALQWPVATVASKFGEIPSGLPSWHWPQMSLGAMRDLMGAAFTIAALGGIESLLSATVADGMTDTRHDSNQELIGQGLANIFCPFLGGIAATGAIARTAANIRSGAHSPVSALIHSGVLLLIAMLAASYAGYIPLAALSGVLITVALRMAEWEDFRSLWHGHRADFLVMFGSFALTVIFDLTIGVGAGLLMAFVMFVRRMEEITHVHLLTPENDPETDGSFSLRGKVVPPGIVLFRFHGPMFFAAADKLETALRASGGKPQAVIFRMRYVPSMDATGVQVFRSTVEKMQHDGVAIFVTGIQPQPMSALFKSGIVDLIGIERFCGNIDEALQKGRELLAQGPTTTGRNQNPEPR